MAGSRGPSSRRDRGRIATLPRGALQVRVYVGKDQLSGRRLYLTETVPAGPKAERASERVRTKLIAQVDERACVPSSTSSAPTSDEHWWGVHRRSALFLDAVEVDELMTALSAGWDAPATS